MSAADPTSHAPTRRRGPYRLLFDAVLTRLDAERAHRSSFAALRAAGSTEAGLVALRKAYGVQSAALRVHALGLDFPSPLGLAAGFDKDAEGIDALAALGFGSVEVGTITAQAQPGNPRPRLFRLVEDDAVVNRMGFNNLGAAAAAERLRRRARRRDERVVLGVNIGKTKVVPEGEAVPDYVASARLLAPYADYLVVNVSSPNTPGLRALQSASALRPLLTAVRAAADDAAGRHVPLLVKIAPDLCDEDVLAVADLALELHLDGIVATNTTLSRDGLRTGAADVDALGAGGLSGAPLAARSLAVLRLLRARVGGRLVLVSVGGVRSAEDVWERILAGASVVQAYTAFVYGGPAWAGRVQRGLLRLLAESPYATLGEAVGAAAGSSTRGDA